MLLKFGGRRFIGGDLPAVACGNTRSPEQEFRYHSLRNGDDRIDCHVAGKHDVAINPEITTVTLDHSAQDFDVHR